MGERAPEGREQIASQQSGRSLQKTARGASSGPVARAFQPATYVLKPISDLKNGSAGGSLFNYVRIGQRHRWMVLSVCVVSMLAAFLYSMRQKPMFRATATFLVARPGILRSRGVGLGVLLRNRPDFLVEHALNPELLDPFLMERFHVPGAGEPMVLLDHLGIEEDSLSERLYLGRSFLERNVEVTVPNESYPFLLAIDVVLDNAELASRIANRLVERVAEADAMRRGRANREHASHIEIQLQTVKLDLKAAEEALEKFLDANRLVSTARLTIQKRRLEREVRLQSGLFIELRTREAFSRLAGDEEVSAVSFVERAYPPREPYTSGAGTEVVLAGVAGLLLALTLACAAESLGRVRFR